MGSDATSVRLWSGNTLAARIRAALSGLGYALGLVTLLVATTAVKFTFDSADSAGHLLASGLYVLFALGSTLLLVLPLIVAASNLAPAAGLRRQLFIAATTSLSIGACFAWPLVSRVTHLPPLNDVAEKQLAILVVMLVAVFEFRHRALLGARALLRTETDAALASAQLQLARMQVLRAQIAPHFLFNTLATVRRLSRIDRTGAAGMLRDLIHYFSIALAHRNEAESTLGREFRLVDAYLRIHRIRMGKRLAYEVLLPSELEAVQVPSMMLLTLVENALKHGIAPLVEGGFVRVAAQRRGATLFVEVADTGRGMAATEGHGTGLANIRARLSMLHGPRARLSLAHGKPRGFIATVQLPIEFGE
jgi:signal transduction histidine kinase